MTFLITKASSDQFFTRKILNKKVFSNKTRYVLIENELNEKKVKLLSTKGYSFFPRSFTSDDVS